MNAPRLRIAPSPTGDPHVGTAYVALFNRAFAAANGGKFILRIDDTDRTRYQSGSDQSIFRALKWLGIEWDEGPEIGGPYAPYRQSERTEIYREACNRMVAAGEAYHCFCTPDRLSELREHQRANKLQGGYDRKCRSLGEEEVKQQLDQGAAFTIRLKVPLEGQTSFRDELRGTISIPNSEVDDQVLLKSDGFPTYHMANVVDDTSMKISHVVRAEEWITSTPKHILIYKALGEELPKFYHVPLLRNKDSSKISKRKNPVSLDWFREQGYLPEALLNFLANLGWSAPDDQEIFDYDFFQSIFKLDDIHTGAPVFDMDKLNWLNGIHMRKLTAEELTARLEEHQFLPEGATSAQVAKVFPLVSERLHLLSDFIPKTDWFFGNATAPTAQDLIPKKMDAARSLSLMQESQVQLGALQDWNLDAIDNCLEEIRTKLELKKPQIFMPLRMAVTGRKDSPPINEVIELLDKATVLDRIKAAEAILQAEAE